MSKATVTDDKGIQWDVTVYPRLRKYSARATSGKWVAAESYSKLLEKILAA